MNIDWSKAPEDAANKMFQRFGGIWGLTKKQCIWVISEGYRKQ